LFPAAVVILFGKICFIQPNKQSVFLFICQNNIKEKMIVDYGLVHQTIKLEKLT